MKKIEIEYNKDGGLKVEAFGFEGQSCLAATKELLERHEGEKDITMKSEAYGMLNADVEQFCG
jgi:hypothetical protein